MHTQSCPTLYNPVDCSPQALSMGFSRQEYWSVLPFPLFLTHGSNPCLLCHLDWQAGSLPLSHRQSPCLPQPHPKENSPVPFGDLIKLCAFFLYDRSYSLCLHGSWRQSWVFFKLKRNQSRNLSTLPKLSFFLFFSNAVSNFGSESATVTPNMGLVGSCMNSIFHDSSIQMPNLKYLGASLVVR